MRLRDLALCVLLLALATTFNILLPFVILIAVVAVYRAIRQAAAWGEGIGYDDGYFDADE